MVPKLPRAGVRALPAEEGGMSGELAFVRNYAVVRARLMNNAPTSVVVPRPPHMAEEPPPQTLDDLIRGLRFKPDDGVKSRFMLAVRAVAALHGVAVEAILSDSRRYLVMLARRDAYKAVAATNPGWTILQIARLFDKDHTSVIYGLKALGYEHGRVKTPTIAARLAALSSPRHVEEGA
jgi:hypothetical protein